MTGQGALMAAGAALAAYFLLSEKDASAATTPAGALPAGPPPGPTPVGPKTPPNSTVAIAPDGTAFIVPGFALVILQQLGNHSAQMADPAQFGLQPIGGAIQAVDRGFPQGLSSAGAWANQAAVSGNYVLLSLNSPHKILHAVGPDGLQEARDGRAAVFLSPIQQLVPGAPAAPGFPGAVPIPVPGGVTPAGVPPLPSIPGVPTPVLPSIPGVPTPGSVVPPPSMPAPPPVELRGLPPEMLLDVMRALETGRSRDLLIMADAVLSVSPSASGYLRGQAARRYDLEKARAKLEGRTFTVRPGLFPSHVAQHYTGDFSRWPEIQPVNPFLRVIDGNLVPWKGELIVPDGWDFSRGQPVSARAAQRSAALSEPGRAPPSASNLAPQRRA
jgi:hypothetical protein